MRKGFSSLIALTASITFATVVPADAVGNSGQLRSVSTSMPVLFEQVSDELPGAIPTYRSDQYPFSLANNMFIESADDFVVPSGTKWRISGIRAAGIWFAISLVSDTTIPSFQVNIREDKDGKPGKMVFSRAINEAGAPSWVDNVWRWTDLRLTSPISLNPGKYWLSVMANNQSGLWLWLFAPGRNWSKPMTTSAHFGIAPTRETFDVIGDADGMQFGIDGISTALRPSCPTSLQQAVC